MSKYVYPAIFTSEDDGGYSVSFPDIESCYTCGDDMADALTMVQTVKRLRQTRKALFHLSDVIQNFTAVSMKTSLLRKPLLFRCG